MALAKSVIDNVCRSWSSSASSLLLMPLLFLSDCLAGQFVGKSIKLDKHFNPYFYTNFSGFAGF